MKDIVIIGAGGHAKVVADIIVNSGDKVIGFLASDKQKGDTFIGYPILGSDEDYQKYLSSYFIIAIGNPKVREKISKKMDNAKWYTAIHPTAVISKINTVIGEGTVIAANAVVNPGSTIGKHCIINTSASVDHDNTIKDYVHVSCGAHLAGTVSVGKYTWIGIGSTVKNGISICSDCMIGAGAVVVKNINTMGTYIGVPANMR